MHVSRDSNMTYMKQLDLQNKSLTIKCNPHNTKINPLCYRPVKGVKGHKMLIIFSNLCGESLCTFVLDSTAVLPWYFVFCSHMKKKQ